MTKTAEERLIGALIMKLGGEVTVTREDFYRAEDLLLTSFDDPQTMGTRFTAAPPPETIVGEVVTEESQSTTPAISPPEAKHDRWRYYGKKQGAECECGAPFYPASGATVDIIAEHRHHVFTTTGVWPQARGKS